MCQDAAFYAYAFGGALSAGLEYSLMDILCPNTIRITLESYSSQSISWSKPSWTMLNIEQVCALN
jgi:hypothetical protein